EEPSPRPAKDDLFHEPWVTTPVPTMGDTLPNLTDLLIDGRLHVSTIRALRAEMEEVEGGTYDLANLVWFQDFRVRVALEYVAQLAQSYGVNSKLVRVLPLPLGASEITIEEAASMYNGLVTGKAWSLPGVGPHGEAIEAPQDPTGLILRITDSMGKTLYEAHPEEEAIADPRSGELVADILRSVVEAGTGRRAFGVAKAGKADVPLGGKTGTTNEFRNAAFLGYAPMATEEGFTLQDAWAIGVYVGYDDNSSMRKGNIALAGASGALPIWVHVARGLGAGERLGSLDKRPGDSRISPGEGLIRTGGPDELPLLTWDGPAPGFQPEGWDTENPSRLKEP
ncbi:MAG: hypothetical protein HN348_23335, partial [Proteobacteria bacterium]|nr:hypothetical protein [Pseudomonadota bacterium]